MDALTPGLPVGVHLVSGASYFSHTIEGGGGAAHRQDDPFWLGADAHVRGSADFRTSLV
jgi:hypothetical protein